MSKEIFIEDEMKSSYLSYAMSVIVQRALPDVRDGFKPVHRRILYAMHEGNYVNFRKSAAIVGDVMRSYHPHGDVPIYEALVRMAQSFAMRSPLVDGQGNFGSIDGDPPAAMRYTESRLAKLAKFLLQDLDKKTVDTTNNYDNTTTEPTVLPARFPNLLVNGASGIAVGMATNIATHNLNELINACIALVKDPDLSIMDLMQYVPGPDFPTGGIIEGRKGILDGFTTGRGSVVIKSKTHVEDNGKREAIIVTQIPYQVNKSRLIENIAELSYNKVIEGISEIRDESDRTGMRIVIELKRGSNSDVILNQLFKHSQLRTTFSSNVVAIIDGRPETLNLKKILICFLDFRREVILRRTRYEFSKNQSRANLMVALILAVSDIDEVIKIIRSSESAQEAKVLLLSKTWYSGDIDQFLNMINMPVTTDGGYKLTEEQAKAILELPLKNLTNLEKNKLIKDVTNLGENIRGLGKVLSCSQTLKNLLIEELEEINQLFVTPRITQIVDAGGDMEEEDLIQREDMVVTVTINSYIKRVRLSEYRMQHRGGKGKSGMQTKDEDVILDVFIANTHTTMLFFSDLGKVYQLRVYKLPLSSPQTKGKALINILPLGQDEKITTILPLPEIINESTHMLFVTSLGNIRKSGISDFLNIRSNGKNAIRLDEREKLVSVLVASDTQDLLMATALGRCIRFSISKLRQIGSKSSNGVRGMRLTPGDEVISATILEHMSASSQDREDYIRAINAQRRVENRDMSLCSPEELAELEEAKNSVDMDIINRFKDTDQMLLSVSNKGLGKRSSTFEYRVTERGGVGISNMDLNRGARLVSVLKVYDDDNLMLITNKGQITRISVSEVRISGRNTQGVMLFRVDPDEYVVSVARVAHEESVDSSNV